ncbi:unnamed protein product, partial [Heterosigma akashiwo]
MDKYSRQIGAYGIEAMGKLVRLNVLIVGLKGVGIECAKNLTLAGPGGVTLLDDTPTEMRDLGSNFFLTEADVGVPRAEVCAPKLQELNPMVQVRAATGELTEELVATHQCVVFTRGTRAEIERWNAFCRSQAAIAFLACDVKGVAGYIFSDFGPSFTIKDMNGENPLTRIITHISNEEEGVVTLLGAFGEEGGRVHGLEESDHDGWVSIDDVEGMEAADGGSINTAEPMKIAFCTKPVFDPFRLKVGDTSRFSEYVNGGVLTQVKKPVAKAYRSFADNLRQPVGGSACCSPTARGFGRRKQLHFAFLALWEFEARHGAAPAGRRRRDPA